MRLHFTLWHVTPFLCMDVVLNNFQKVNIHVDYVTALEPEITRTLRLTRVVLVSLPLTINVEDFFRGTRYTALDSN